MDRILLDDCYREALRLLRENSTPGGVLASARNERAEGRSYASIFGRDASICALGMVASGESDLVDSAVRGIRTLAQHQAGNGQIPKFVKPELGEVDFWYSGCIDATLWWLIALDFVERMVPSLSLQGELAANAALAVNWLQCQEHQGWFLVQQNEASDWADIMPRAGFVLYSNALWYWTKRLYDLPDAAQTREHMNQILSPFQGPVPGQRRVRLLRHFIRNRSKPSPLYLSFVNLAVWGEDEDLFGNILAHLVGVGDSSRAEKTVAHLVGIGANRPYPVRVVGAPIGRDNPLWRRYMERHKQNYPWQYHNGGIWPFVGGFWILLLAKLGKNAEAWQELENLARVSRINGWEFNEWLQGQTGEPMGMARQSWNAALYILAYRTLVDGIRFLP